MKFLFKKKQESGNSETVFNSKLYDEKSFYTAFLKDLDQCKEEVIIESPFITSSRMQLLWPIFNKLLAKGVKIYIVTRPPEEHEESLRRQAVIEIRRSEFAGVQTLLCVGSHHRKLAMIDRKILWEGSLNILSQTKSREIMRRIDSRILTMEMFQFLKLGKFV